jgi:hypothetical protein
MSTMEATTRGQLVHTETRDSYPVTVVWAWVSHDPYAITATVLIEGASTVWTFGHQLLTDALDTPGERIGSGDVRLMYAPGITSDGLLMMALVPPGDDHVVVAMPAEALHTLARRLGTAPNPDEAVAYDLDHELEAILASS